MVTRARHDPRRAEEAMLRYLAGDDTVVTAARRLWDAAGAVATSRHLQDVQPRLQAAIDEYSAAILGCRVPAQHAPRVGAALMLRLSRTWASAEDPGSDHGRPAPTP